MAHRTFVFGDLHGDLAALRRALARMPRPDADDRLVFLGDYLDRGPDSRGVVAFVREVLPRHTEAQIVTLRGNHEDSWLRVVDGEWPDFVLPPGNGCLQCYQSYTGQAVSLVGAEPSDEVLAAMLRADFFPADVVAWMRALPCWFEDEHAIYVHAGLPEDGRGGYVHPRDAVAVPKLRRALLWLRDERFFRDYRGKTVVVGHTVTKTLPPELSDFTPEDPTDLWAGPAVFGLDTGAGKRGFLTVLELPSGRVYESRE